jgi:uncharacterized short protein YbdD (DUF466 family)
MNGIPAQVRLFFRRAAQTGRIMVGAGDYATYLEHMKSHHPQHAPMTERDYFRYCQEARYPTKSGTGGKISRCPC